MSGAPPDVALRVNLHGTMNMLEATRAWQEEASSISSSPISLASFQSSSESAASSATLCFFALRASFSREPASQGYIANNFAFASR